MAPEDKQRTITLNNVHKEIFISIKFSLWYSSGSILNHACKMSHEIKSVNTWYCENKLSRKKTV